MPLFRGNQGGSPTLRNIRSVVDEAKNLEMQGEREKARLLYRRVLRYATEEFIPEKEKKAVAEILIDIGNSLAILEDYDKAIDSFEMAKREDPINPKSWLAIGRLLLSRNLQISYAESNLEEAKKIDPNNPDVWKILGEIYEQEGKIEEAKKAYMNALNLNPDDPEVNERFYALSSDKESLLKYLEFLKRKNDKEKLLEVYLKLISMGETTFLGEAKVAFPDNPRIATIEAKIMIDNNNFQEAEEILNGILKNNPENVEANTLLDYIKIFAQRPIEELPPEMRIPQLVRNGRVTEAIELAKNSGLTNEDIFFIALSGKDYDDALKIVSDFPNFKVYEAIVNLERNPEEAERELNKYVSSNQKDALAWIVKSIMADWKNNEMGAKNFLNMALRINPNVARIELINKYKNFKDRDWLKELKK